MGKNGETVLKNAAGGRKWGEEVQCLQFLVHSLRLELPDPGFEGQLFGPKHPGGKKCKSRGKKERPVFMSWW